MPKIQYIAKDFSAPHLIIIQQANEILEEYELQGFDLTLRQLYYQFVARDLIENKKQSYQRLSKIISDARLAGLIDWERIEDRTRNIRGLAHWDNPEEILDSVARQYHIDHWAKQEYRVEVWIEKDALVGVIERVCNELDVSYFSCRGYTSQSEMWRAAMRLESYRNNGQKPVVIHLGDHDPSGIDMTRDIQERLNLFMSKRVSLHRIALNMSQIRQYNPPPNFAKVTDSRAKDYIAKYGKSSWELDALEPKTMEQLIRTTVSQFINEELWNKMVRKQKRERSQLKALSDKWTNVKKHLRGK